MEVSPVEEETTECDESNSEGKSQNIKPKRKSYVPLEPECSTSKRMERASVSQETSVVKSVDTNAGSINLQKASFIAANLPELVLKKILSYLHIKDIINAQQVCTSWNCATKDTLVWKHAPLNLDIYGLEILQSAPYLHTVVGSFQSGNELLDALVDNVMDLRKMDWYVYESAFSVANFERFVKKFKNLEYIMLYNNVPGFIESLNILNSCSNLKALSLSCDSDVENFPETCRIIRDGFSALEVLEVVRICGGGITSDLSSLLEKKIHHFTELKISFSDIHPEIFELIFKSSRLVTLKIEITEQPEFSLNLGLMIGLKSLKFVIFHKFQQPQSQSFENPPTVNVYKMVVFPPNLESLKIHFPVCVKPHVGIISNVISSLPQLKVLRVHNIDDHDLDKQLKNISNLQNLHTISLCTCKGLSSEGVQYIMKCPSLKKLKFSEVTFEDSTYDCFKKCIYLGELKLFSCTVTPEKLLEAILAMKYLTNVQLSCCKYINERQQHVLFVQSIINSMLTQCRQEKHYVKIQL